MATASTNPANGGTKRTGSGPDPRPPTPPPRKWNDLLFGVQRSSRYHRERERHYARFTFWTRLLTILITSYTIGSLLLNGPDLVAAIALAVVPLLNSIVFAADIPGKTFLHRDLANQFVLLESKIRAGILTADDESYIDLSDERRRIETREPPQLEVLAIAMHNRVALSRGEMTNLYKISWLQACLKNFADIAPDKIRLQSQQSG